VNIHFLHTNDIHSRLENYMRVGFQLRSLRNRLRSAGEPVFTVDIGDLIDRVRPETEATLGLINARMMAALDVDAYIFGNNEGLTIPPKDWKKLVIESNAITFGTNLRGHQGNPYSFLHDTHIFGIQGVRVGMFGLTPDYTVPYDMLGVTPLPPFERAAYAVNQLQLNHVDIIVCLSHLGLQEDRKLAFSVPGIDVILGGHTHQFMNEAEYVHGTAIFQPGKHALAFGHTTLEYDCNQRKLVSVRSYPIETDIHGPMDEAMNQAYQSLMPEVSAVLEQSLADFSSSVPVLYDDESPFGNALVDSLYHTFPCDAGIMMAGALTASLLPGVVKFQDILAACSTPTRPIVISLTGKVIYDMIQRGIQPASYDQTGIGFGFRGSVVGYLTVANMDVFLHPDKRRVDQIFINQELVDEKKLYRIVTCEYLWLSRAFPMVQEASEITFYPPLVREVLLDKLSTPHLLETAKQRRYHISYTS
jgi:5'-nucleotidase